MTFKKSKPCAEYGCSKPVFSNKLCKYHAAIKALKTPNKKVVSEKKKERLAKYYELRDAYLKEHTVCERCGTTRNLTLHHLRGRGKYLLEYFCCLCLMCHSWVHDHPVEAEKEGFLMKRNYKDNG